MTLQDIGIITGIITGAGSLISVFYLAVAKLARLELKVDTMWEFQIRMAEGEAVKKGIASRNSPLEITAEARSWMGTLALDLKNLYRSLGKPPQATLMLEIERRYGQRLLDEVCIPHGLFEGAGLLLADHVAREVL